MGQSSMSQTTDGNVSGPITLGGQRQLFIDDYLIASMDKVTRKVHTARKHPANPLIWPREAWEGRTSVVYGSVLRDEGRYRMWYHSDRSVAYAESHDGVVWEKTRMDHVVAGGQRTNLLFRPEALPCWLELLGVHRDDADPDPSQRYKLGFLSLDRPYSGPHEDPFHPGERRGLGVAASPDGSRWKPIDNWTTHAVCDGAMHWMFDPARGKYVLYGRTRFTSPQVKAAWGNDEWFKRHYWGRAVARVESPDFLHWDFSRPDTAPVVMAVDTEDAVGDEIYSMLVFPYEGMYIGLVQMFHSRPDDSYLDIQLAVSRDSVHFERVGDRSPFLPVGPVAAWDRFNNSLANNPPIEVGDELRIYYGGRTHRHPPYAGADGGRPGCGGIGLASVPRDRFVGLQATFDTGRVVTKPLRLAGTALHLNAKCDFGHISIEAMDAGGRVIAESLPIQADALDIPVRWRHGRPEQSESPVTLRITMENAHLFAIWSA